MRLCVVVMLVMLRAATGSGSMTQVLQELGNGDLYIHSRKEASQIAMVRLSSGMVGGRGEKPAPRGRRRRGDAAERCSARNDRARVGTSPVHPILHPPPEYPLVVPCAAPTVSLLRSRCQPLLAPTESLAKTLMYELPPPNF